jgi:hypothetical protein
VSAEDADKDDLRSEADKDAGSWVGTRWELRTRGGTAVVEVVAVGRKAWGGGWPVRLRKVSGTTVNERANTRDLLQSPNARRVA